MAATNRRRRYTFAETLGLGAGVADPRPRPEFPVVPMVLDYPNAAPAGRNHAATVTVRSLVEQQLTDDMSL